MDTIDPRQGWADHVEAEHRHFGRMINEIRHAFDAQVESGNVAAAVAVARDKLTVFNQQMRAHFEMEEEGGYMEEAVARLPVLSHNADKLIAEHTVLRTAIDHLVKHLETVGDSATKWNACRDEFKRLSEQIATHEANENWLLHEGFNEPDSDVA
jgi:chromosome condensin MukBEF ATPase and DNA-binding subunit MukB